MFQWQLKYFSASETGSHICDPRLGRVNIIWGQIIIFRVTFYNAILIGNWYYRYFLLNMIGFPVFL